MVQFVWHMIWVSSELRMLEERSKDAVPAIRRCKGNNLNERYSWYLHDYLWHIIVWHMILAFSEWKKLEEPSTGLNLAASSEHELWL